MVFPRRMKHLRHPNIQLSILFSRLPAFGNANLRSQFSGCDTQDFLIHYSNKVALMGLLSLSLAQLDRPLDRPLDRISTHQALGRRHCVHVRPSIRSSTFIALS
jgi:hypothetical protein